MQLTGIFSGNKVSESCLSLEASGFSDPEAVVQGLDKHGQDCWIPWLAPPYWSYENTSLPILVLLSLGTLVSGKMEETDNSVESPRGY